MPISPTKVLVVTDKFAPDIVGGAEISLKSQLDGVKAGGKFDIHVVALSDPQAVGSGAIRTEIYDGYKVSRVNFEAHWPPLANRLSRIKSFRTRLGLFALFGFSALHYLLTASQTKKLQKFRNLLTYANLVRHNQRALMPIMDKDNIDYSYVPDLLQKLIDDHKPDLVHFDNYRSIILGSVLKTAVPKLAMVRDHRFYCSHPMQSAHVNGAECKSCYYQCTVSQGHSARTGLSALLDDNHRYRNGALSDMDHIATTSNFLERQIISLFPDRNISVVPNSAQPLAKDLCLKKTPFNEPPEILIVGMIGDNKGQTTIPQWLPLLKQQLDQFKVVVAGRGSAIKTIEEQVDALGLSDHIEFTSFLPRDELAQRYQQSTVVCIPNRWPEPFGRVPLEAARFARPVVGYAIGGITETVINGETGILVPPQDQSALIDALVKVVQDKKLAKKLGDAAQLRIDACYSNSNSVKKLEALWSGCLKQSVVTDE